MPASITRTYRHADFDALRLAHAKAGTTVSVCLPARDEAATVGRIVEVVRRELVDRVGLVDEVVVIDDRSRDDTAAVAEAAGARVERGLDVLPQYHGGGKGEALWKSVHAADGDVVVWCDADITDFDARFVIGLVGPLLLHPEIGFVKGFYERPLLDGDQRDGGQGGRVTELAARPLLALLHPHLGSIVQPLAGEYAGRREILEELPFVQGYGVDLGLLIDVADRFGLEVVAQVDLGTRRHRNRTLAELGPMAMAVAQTAFVKARLPLDHARCATLVRPGLDAVELAHVELPPLASVVEYVERRRRGAEGARSA